MLEFMRYLKLAKKVEKDMSRNTKMAIGIGSIFTAFTIVMIVLVLQSY